MSDDLLADGDPCRALRRLFHRGAPRPDGRPMPGLGQLLQRLRGQRQQRLDPYDLGSAPDDITQQLDEVIRTERKRIGRRVPTEAERATPLAPPDRLHPDPPA